MRNRPDESDPAESAGHAGRESALVLSGFLFVAALRPVAFVIGQAWVALRPMVEMLGLDEWQQVKNPDPRER